MGLIGGRAVRPAHHGILMHPNAFSLIKTCPSRSLDALKQPEAILP